MGKIIDFASRINQLPDTPILPDEVTLMTCDYDENLNPVLIIKTTDSTHCFKLGKPTKYSDYQQRIKKHTADELLDFLKKNHLLSEKVNLKDDYRLGYFAIEINNAWYNLRLQRYFKSLGKNFTLAEVPALSTQKRVLSKYVDEEHIEELRTLIKNMKNEGWIWDKMESTHMRIATTM